MELNGWLQVFLGGAMGPVVVELAKLSQMREGKISRLYRRATYWLLSIPLVLLGGLAAVAHGTENVSVWTALHLGATSPLIFAALASGRPPDGAHGLMPETAPPKGWELLRW